jgi:hypothetical protein
MRPALKFKVTRLSHVRFDNLSVNQERANWGLCYNLVQPTVSSSHRIQWMTSSIPPALSYQRLLCQIPKAYGGRRWRAFRVDVEWKSDVFRSNRKNEALLAMFRDVLYRSSCVADEKFSWALNLNTRYGYKFISRKERLLRFSSARET